MTDFKWQIENEHGETLQREVVVDSETMGLDEFRRAEALQTLEYLKQEKGFILVNANSGYGVSKFFLPQLTNLNNSCRVVEYGIQSESGFLKELELVGKNGILIIDELPSSFGGKSDAIDKVFETIKEHKDIIRDMKIQIVLIADFILYSQDIDWDVIQEIKDQSLPDRTNQLIDVMLKPKLFNVSQSVEYLTNKYDDVQLAKKIVAEFDKRALPRHFRLLETIGFEAIYANDGLSKVFDKFQSDYFTLRKSMGSSGFIDYITEDI